MKDIQMSNTVVIIICFTFIAIPLTEHQQEEFR